MNEEATQRISKTTAAFMIAVAVLFDLAQIASKILSLLGLTVLGGIGGLMLCNYVNIELPKSCTIVGAGIGAVASFTGIGTAIALKIGMIMDWLASSLFALMGYSLMYFWFWHQGVPILSGQSAAKKMAASLTALLVDAIPFINAMPGITIWTTSLIYITRREDKEKAKSADTGYNGGKNYARMRKSLRRYVPTHT